VKDQFEKKKKNVEADLAYFKILSQHVLGGTVESNEEPQDSRPSEREQIPGLPNKNHE
jgi:hypothetical protein